MANSSLSVILLVIYFTSFCFRYSVHDETVFFAGEVVSKNKEIRERVDSAVWYVLVSCRIFNFEDFLCRIWISHNHKFARFFPRNLEFCQILNSQHLSAESWVLLYLEFSAFALPNPEFPRFFAPTLEFSYFSAESSRFGLLHLEFSFILNFQDLCCRIMNFICQILNFQDLSRRIFNFAKSWIFQIFPANIEFCKVLNFSDLFCWIRNFAKFWNSRFAPTDLEFF